MEKIYTITTISRLEKDELGWPDFGDTRTVGWVSNLDLATDCVINNYGDIWETCYSFAIIEEVEEGLYPCASNRWFFEFDEEKNEYKPIDEPGWMKNFVNIGIG